MTFAQSILVSLGLCLTLSGAGADGGPANQKKVPDFTVEPELQKKIDQAIKRGQEFLLQELKSDRRPESIPLTLHALIQTGLSPDHEMISRAVSKSV